MPLDLGIEKSNVGKPNILVVGVGGGGGNAVDNMIDSGLGDCTFLACNTDMQALLSSQADERLQLGPTETRGLGAGANPEVGRIAAEESREEFQAFLKDVDMVFFAAGMGGGTGTGSLPVLADVAKEAGVLSMAVVTRPFRFEGRQRARAADEGVAKLEAAVDTLIVVPNQKLIGHASQQTSIKDAFRQADSVLVNGVRSVVDLILRQGIVNLDFSDVCSVVRNGGNAMMGSAEADGENRAREAAEHAVFNSLLENSSLKGAQNLLINITGGDDLGLLETDEASNFIESQVDQEANIIWGAVHDTSMNGKIRVSVIATGIQVDPMTGGGEAASRVAKAPQILAPLPPVEKTRPQQPDVQQSVEHQEAGQAVSSEIAPEQTVATPSPTDPNAQQAVEPPQAAESFHQSVGQHEVAQPQTPSVAIQSPPIQATPVMAAPTEASFPNSSQHDAVEQNASESSRPSAAHVEEQRDVKTAVTEGSKPASQQTELFETSQPTESYTPNRNPHEHYKQERGSFFSRAPWARGSNSSDEQEPRPVASFLDRFGKKNAESHGGQSQNTGIQNTVTYPLREAKEGKAEGDGSSERTDESKIPDFLMQ